MSRNRVRYPASGGPRDPHFRPRLPRRAAPRAPVVRQVPAPGRAPAPEAHRPGVDRAVGRPPATSPSGARRRGWTICSPRPVAACCRGWCGPVPPSPTPRPSGCAGPSTSGPASRHADRLPLHGSPIWTRPSASCGSRRSAAGAIERWKATLTVSNRTIHKYLVVMHGIFRRAMRVWGCRRTRSPRSTGHASASPTTSACVLARGDMGAGPCGLVGLRTAPVPDRRFHWAAHGRAARAAVGRHRLRRPVDSGAPQLQRPRRLSARRRAARSARCRWCPTSPPPWPPSAPESC